jgi:hypothetical protein
MSPLPSFQYTFRSYYFIYVSPIIGFAVYFDCADAVVHRRRRMTSNEEARPASRCHAAAAAAQTDATRQRCSIQRADSDVYADDTPRRTSTPSANAPRYAITPSMFCSRLSMMSEWLRPAKLPAIHYFYVCRAAR